MRNAAQLQTVRAPPTGLAASYNKRVDQTRLKPPQIYNIYLSVLSRFHFIMLRPDLEHVRPSFFNCLAALDDIFIIIPLIPLPVLENLSTIIVKQVNIAIICVKLEVNC